MTDREMEITMGLALAATSIFAMLKGRRKKRQGKVPADPLDRPLFYWTPDDPFTARHLVAGGVSIMGRAGSGKTSASGKLLAESIVGVPGSGGLILAAKPVEDRQMWQGIFERAGRKDDLLIFAPDQPHRFNFTNYEMEHGGDTRNITKAITVIGETLRGNDTKGGENSDFWETAQNKMLHNAIEVVKDATGKVDAWDLQRFITDAAQSPEQIQDVEWAKGIHAELLTTSKLKEKSGRHLHDAELSYDYWLVELPNMDPRTRANISSGLLGILFVFNTGMVRELVSSETNISPDVMFQGKWVLVDMPPSSEYGDAGSFVSTGWKYLTQKAVLRRHPKPDDPLHVIWCDEFPNFFTTFDSRYVAECRSRKAAMVVLAQGLDSYYSVLAGNKGKAQVGQFLTQMNHKVFHALGSATDAQYAAALVGRSMQVFVGGSPDNKVDPWDVFMGKSAFNPRFDERIEQAAETSDFMHGLRTGGPPDFVCDGIVIKSGEPFSNGQNMLRIEFSQK